AASSQDHEIAGAACQGADSFRPGFGELFVELLNRLRAYEVRGVDRHLQNVRVNCQQESNNANAQRQCNLEWWAQGRNWQLQHPQWPQWGLQFWVPLSAGGWLQSRGAARRGRGGLLQH